MSAYEIEIEGRTYAGHYNSQANAVFGAMRFRENELQNESTANLDLSFQHHPQGPATPTNPGDWDTYRRRSAARRAALEQTTRIIVRPASMKVPKKVHRLA